MSYKVTLERNTLRFAAAHMATFGGDLEPLHGHNYALHVEFEGSLTPDSWVIDFGEAKRMARAVCDELDHRFLLQAEGTALDLRADGAEYEVRFGDRRYVFPAADVVELPIDNTTAERLAEWFASRLSEALADRAATSVMSITVGVEEAPGQAGWFTLKL